MTQKSYPTTFPPQHQQRQPGLEIEMNPRPFYDNPQAHGSGKLQGKTAIVTGGDSGIGRAVAVAFAKEGADVAIVFLDEHQDAEETARAVQQYGRMCLSIAADIGVEEHCKNVVRDVMNTFGRIDVLVNNAAEQHPQNSLEYITAEQIEKTFRTNVFSFFYMTKAALPHMQSGSSIVNTTSITAYKGHEQLIDYSATKGAIVAFTRSLSQQLVGRGIRVNAVAPGPIWTPLIPSTFPAEQVAKFGSDTPMKRAGQPIEVAPSYVFLASDDASYMSGQVLHVNGGTVVNG
ncbi:SDR family oxidoreductase [Alicyclobacillus pomorum]|uniref:SDR family oxidoreductase n=1 Tax=Alicyclobacillus pomorum TaxID=204470 RepID=UPI0004179357|nr:SDR family oxidoreductase [Alicyclobacillus pomorum]